MELKVLTLNCWGLPDFLTTRVYKSYNRPEVLKGRKWNKRTMRMTSIASRLENFDIICLEEVWIQDDRDTLISICKSRGLAHSCVFYSGLLGSSGLVVISRYPIEYASFHPYRINGQVLRVDHGDYHVGKGFGHAKIRINDNLKVNVLLTHTIAQYYSDDCYRADRISQIWDIVRFLDHSTDSNMPFIICGDMNCNPKTVEYSILTQVGNLIDSFEEINQVNINPSKNQGYTLLNGNERLDYIFYRKCRNFEVVSSKVQFHDGDVIYSDHFGVTSTFLCSNVDSNTMKIKNSYTNEMNNNNNNSVNNNINNSENINMENDRNRNEGEGNQENVLNLKNNVLKKCSSLVLEGATRADKRKTSHLIRSIISLLLLWLLISVHSPYIWIFLVSIFFVLEIVIALFFVENEISTLKQVQKELAYHIK